MSCEILDKDLTFIVQDYGPNGYIGSAALNLQHGMKPGAVIYAVTNTSESNEINIRDIQSNILLHIVNRIGRNDFGINSYINGKWLTEEKFTPIPVQKGVRTVTTIAYEEEGYRIFINDKQISFYKHQAKTDPHTLEIKYNSQILKIIYITPRSIIP